MRLLSPTPDYLRFRDLFTRVSSELPCWRKFTELMPHHKFRHIYRDKFVPVVYCKRVAYEIRCDRGTTAPCFYNRFLAFAFIDRQHLFFKMAGYIRTFFNRTSHLFLDLRFLIYDVYFLFRPCLPGGDFCLPLTFTIDHSLFRQLIPVLSLYNQVITPFVRLACF